MDWNSMKVFLAVAEHHNLVAASKALKMSHSTVFRRLQSLEEHVGSHLFEKDKGVYRLTELGEELAQLGKRVSNSFDDIERKVIGRDLNPHGIVKITTPTSIAYNLLPNCIAEFARLHPNIKLEILISDQEVNMRNRNADIALRVTQAPPEYLVGRQIREIKWGVYACEAYIEQNGKPSETADIAAHELIGASGTLAHMAAFTWMDKNGSGNITIRSDDLVSMSHMCAASLGLAILPDDLKLPDIQRLFTFKSAPANKLWVLTHPDLRKVERIKIVMKYLTVALSL
jgi:DNA-binding transcriptional LysR family regulator